MHDEDVARPRRGTTRRGLAVLIAALTVVLLTGATAAAVAWVRHRPGTSQAPATAWTPSDLGFGDPFFRLGPDQVPSITGLDADQATKLLEQHGYDVVTSTRRDCPSADDELWLSPQTGAIVRPGTVVTLHETVAPPGADCAQGDHPDARVLAFLAWARGIGPTPAFADTVHVQFSTQSASGGDTRTLRGDQRTDRATWPGLAALAQVLAAPARGGEGLLPLVATRFDATCAPVPGGACPDMLGAALGGAAGATNRRADTASLFDVTLQIEGHGPGRITAVSLVDHRPSRSNSDVDVVGDSIAYARARLRLFGLSSIVRDVDSCAPRGQVVSAKPSGPTVVAVEVSRGNASCAD